MWIFLGRQRRQRIHRRTKSFSNLEGENLTKHFAELISIFELDWELILISLPALPQCFQSLKSETFGKQEAKRNIVLSLRNNDLKKAKSPEGCETHSTSFDSYRCTDWRRNSQKERNEKKKRRTGSNSSIIQNHCEEIKNQTLWSLKVASRPKKGSPKLLLARQGETVFRVGYRITDLINSPPVNPPPNKTRHNKTKNV